ncbi:hypothetical protein PI124_g15465 [Phytophthora idaei]|nr:hypothetical protein PI125_g15433 [Phytophthora idaei]KAG3142849.1 hypothetical protein PI126_g14867 [Phytophthora idaei]KAG3239600.1 hypothetical protein PI124_g15465 [Phytophthora idaei]
MTIGEIDHSNPITLNRFILDEKEIQGSADLSVLFSSIELACKVIASSSKDGKLRLLYEGNPMSFTMEQAGGASTTGTERVFDLCPTHIHQRSPIFLGCKRDVQRVIELYKQFGEEK